MCIVQRHFGKKLGLSTLLIFFFKDFIHFIDFEGKKHIFCIFILYLHIVMILTCLTCILTLDLYWVLKIEFNFY